MSEVQRKAIERERERMGYGFWRTIRPILGLVIALPLIAWVLMIILNQ